MSDKNTKSTKGEGFVWFSSLGLSIGLIMTTGILFLIVVEGVSVFWPKDVEKITLKADHETTKQSVFAGEVTLERERRHDFLTKNPTNGKEIHNTEYIPETQFYLANRDIYGFSFKYVDDSDIEKREIPTEIMMIERAQNSRALLIPVQLNHEEKTTLAKSPNFDEIFEKRLKKAEEVRGLIKSISKGPIARISMKATRLKVECYPHLQKIALNKNTNKLITNYNQVRDDLTKSVPGYMTFTKDQINKLESYQIEQINLAASLKKQILEKNPNFKNVLTKITALETEMDELTIQGQLKIDEIDKLKQQLNVDILVCEDITGVKTEISLGNIVHYYYPNKLGLTGKVSLFWRNIGCFLWEDPREANTEGGVFPAIVGTVIMTLLMCILVTPLGVIAAIYLHEYANNGPIVKMVRVAINNLAGVPSIVFGAFGLGFFIYLTGGSIDKLFYSDWTESGAGPVFGTGGILWASLTLALMTLPVVIVASEEALAAVPRGMREGAFGCGASKWQMIRTVVLPASAPGVLTGMILAMARGAGEVAPLMLVGVMKVASSLPIDNIYPYVHLDQKFMHLGFHIYDLGFQSPDSEASKPMVFATTLLLISIVCTMNLICVFIRQRLRKKYATGAF